MPDTPGYNGAAELHHYWTKGKGAAKWLKSPHPWTALHRHLSKYIKNPDKLDRTTSQWYHDSTGHWVGEKKGKNPVGPG